FSSLSQLYEDILKGRQEKGLLLSCLPEKARYVIFSDQHKGARDAADDFMNAADNYMSALNWYYGQGYTFINLGDCEELGENMLGTEVEKNRRALLEEARFMQQELYYRVFGHHDLEWNYAVPRMQFLNPLFAAKLKLYEGLILQIPYNRQTFS